MDKYLKKLKKDFEVITDPEEIYWNEYFNDQSVSVANGKDIRGRYCRKPIMIITEKEKYIIEFDYAPEETGWIVHSYGGIFASGLSKDRAIFKLYLHLND